MLNKEEMSLIKELNSFVGLLASKFNRKDYNNDVFVGVQKILNNYVTHSHCGGKKYTKEKAVIEKQIKLMNKELPEVEYCRILHCGHSTACLSFICHSKLDIIHNKLQNRGYEDGVFDTLSEYLFVLGRYINKLANAEQTV